MQVKVKVEGERGRWKGNESKKEPLLQYDMI